MIKITYNSHILDWASSLLCREPSCLAELLGAIQKKCGVVVPANEEEWATCPRTHIVISRESVLEDSLREVRKARFDSTKILNVSRRLVTDRS